MTDTALIEKLTAEFTRAFGGGKPSHISRAAGRAELIGGHTDYNDGFVIAAAIDKSYYVAAGPRDDNIICLYSAWAQEKYEFDAAGEIQREDKAKWANYAKGVVHYLRQAGLKIKGCDLYLWGNVPIGAGLSSSAAMEISIAKAVKQLSDPHFGIEPVEIAKICQKAENDFALSPCGIMDQMVCVNGLADHAIFLDCRDLGIEHVPLDHKAASIMIFNSMVRHEVGAGEYGDRRKACERAVNTIAMEFGNVIALRDANRTMLDTARVELDQVTYKRAQHVIGENQRVLDASKALRKEDVEAFGKLMTASHESARDLYEISCPEIDFLVQQVIACDGALGARLSGGGFGGAAVALVRPGSEQQIAQKVGKAYKQNFGIDSDIYTTKASKATEMLEC